MIDRDLLDINPAHLVRTLKRAGLQPALPFPYGPSGVRVGLGARDGSVLVSQAPWDGVEWLHASIAWNDRMPSYDDLTALKAAVFGDRREAYQVFPARSQHVNIHHFALHLFGRADGRAVLPEFGRWGTI